MLLMDPILQGAITGVFTVIAYNFIDKRLPPKIKGVKRFALSLLIIVSLVVLICLMLKPFITES